MSKSTKPVTCAIIRAADVHRLNVYNHKWLSALVGSGFAEEELRTQHTLIHQWYLAGVVVVEPTFQMDGIPAWHQTAILEDP